MKKRVSVIRVALTLFQYRTLQGHAGAGPLGIQARRGTGKFPGRPLRIDCLWASYPCAPTTNWALNIIFPRPFLLPERPRYYITYNCVKASKWALFSNMTFCCTNRSTKHTGTPFTISMLCCYSRYRAASGNKAFHSLS